MSYRNKEEKEKPKFNHYDLSNMVWKQSVLDFEKEFNDFDGGFQEFMISKGGVKIENKLEIITNLPVYEELNQKLNALNFLRYLRKKAQQYEAEHIDAIADNEINIKNIPF